MTRSQLTPSLLLTLSLIACKATSPGAPAATVQIPVPSGESKREPESVREQPPQSGPAHETRFPAVAHDDLANGLHLELVEAHALPIAHLRLVIQSGSAADGDLTGVANLTAQMLKDGGAGKYVSRDLLAKIETLGADLGISVGADSTVLSLAVTRSHFDEALDLLATIAREPRFSDGEFNKLKKRELDRVADRAKSSGTWSATMLLWRELYRLPTGLHPYASYDALPGEIQRVTLQNCRDFFKRNYIPKNSALILAGDLDREAARKSVERAFGSWKGGEPTSVRFGEATPPDHLRIFLADRPRSAQSDIYVGMLGPTRKDESWTALKVANQVLGGGVSGRLFNDVREKRSLAYNTRSTVGELAQGPVPLTAYAGTQTAKTGLAVQALLDNLQRIGGEPADSDELNTARRFLADIFAIKMETIGSVADMTVMLRVLGLPDDYYDTYRKEIRDVSAEAAQKAMGEHVRTAHAILVVAGDAESIGPVLSHFGEVTVVSPTNDFKRLRTIPANPEATIELERKGGQ